MSEEGKRLIVEACVGLGVSVVVGVVIVLYFWLTTPAVSLPLPPL